MTIVDTSVWIDFLEGGSHWTKERLKRKIEDRESICYIEFILLEVIQGVREQRDRELLAKRFDSFVLLPHSRRVTLLASDIYQDLQRQGIRIRSVVDCVIAAVSIEHGCSVLHKDRDFTFIAEHYPIICESE